MQIPIWALALVVACATNAAPSRRDAAHEIADALCTRARACGDTTPPSACADNALEQLCGEGYDCGDAAADTSALKACLSAAAAMPCGDAPDVGQGSPPAVCRDVLAP